MERRAKFHGWREVDYEYRVFMLIDCRHKSNLLRERVDFALGSESLAMTLPWK